MTAPQRQGLVGPEKAWLIESDRSRIIALGTKNTFMGAGNFSLSVILNESSSHIRRAAHRRPQTNKEKGKE